EPNDCVYISRWTVFLAKRIRVTPRVHAEFRYPVVRVEHGRRNGIRRERREGDAVSVRLHALCHPSTGRDYHGSTGHSGLEVDAGALRPIMSGVVGQQDEPSLA